MPFTLDIVTPFGKIFSEDVDRLSVPTSRGTIGVLARHVPLFSALTEGEVKIMKGNKDYFFAIGGGFMEITKTHVSILVSRAVHADELNEAEIKRAGESAKEVVRKKAKGAELQAARAALRRSLIELKVLNRRFRRRSTSLPSE